MKTKSKVVCDSAFDAFATISIEGKASLKYLATSFDASLKGKWREHLVVAHRYLILRAKGMCTTECDSDEEITVNGEEEEEEEEEEEDKSSNNTTSSDGDVALFDLLRSVVIAIQAVRVSPRARSRLLSDCLCPKPWSSDLLLYILLALIETILPDPMTESIHEKDEIVDVQVFTGSRNANQLSDNETYICALALSHECMHRLDFSVDTVWKQYLALERRIYQMVLYTNMDNELYHTAVFEHESNAGRCAQGQKKTILLHTMAAISASVWGRRMSHSCIASMQRNIHPNLMPHDGIDPSLSVLKDMLMAAYREWNGTRFRLAICKGRCNALCRSHDTEIFSFLSNGVAATGAAMSDSVEMAFMSVPQVLKVVHDEYDALKFADHEVFCDQTAILYLSNSMLKQKFDISLLDRHVLIEPDVVKNISAISAARYRQPCIACGPGGNWGVLYWKPGCGAKRKAQIRDDDNDNHSDKAQHFARFIPGSILNKDYPLVASLAIWLKLYCVHLNASGGAVASKALDAELHRFVMTI